MAKRKRGRPTLPKAERKRGVLGFRARDELRQWLTDAAKLSGRSVSEEIEHRLEQSFETPDLIAGAFRAAFGETNGDLMRAITTAIWLTERRTGKKWNEDEKTASHVREAIETVAHALLEMSPLTPERAFFVFHPVRDHQLARNAALETLQKMGMAPSDAEIAEASKKSHSELLEAAVGKTEKK